jgi:hypothetical protein
MVNLGGANYRIRPLDVNETSWENEYSYKAILRGWNNWL